MSKKFYVSWENLHREARRLSRRQLPASQWKGILAVSRGLAVFGQKTSYSLTSALDRINVVRMLIKIKREIRKASMAYLFELNDRITRESIKQMCDDYLFDIMQRRGLYDFLVVCDESNNSSIRIDRNELWVTIFVKPAKSIEFIYIPIRVVSTGAKMGG